MRNEALSELDWLLGDWELTLSDAWFLDPRDTVLHGHARVTWLADSLIHLTSELDGKPLWDIVIGRSDANDRYVLLYSDERGVGRAFDMTFADGRWEWTREDPDFHQRFVSTVTKDGITGQADASEDLGGTWRKDFDLVFSRA